MEMEGWQMCSLLLTINADSMPGEQQHSGCPLFIKTFLFNIASVITEHLKSSPVISKYLAQTSSTGIYLLLTYNTSKTLMLSWFAHRYIVWNFSPLEKMKNHGGRRENGEFWAGAGGGGKRERGENRREKKNRSEKEAFLATDTM